ncbi:MAG TPA: BON domain-containing protein [Gemmatales bacterium]|nr:BON domain-containing protein [Gemmatales bacterium]
MRHYLLWNTLTLLGTTVTGTVLFADTPVKPTQASFTSPFTSKEVKPAPVDEKLFPRAATPTTPLVVEPEKAVVIDYSVKAASIEVAWLQDPITYPLHLRAEKIPDQNAIVLTGYVPNERMRDKAIAVARLTVENLTVIDQMQVMPNMALAYDVPLEPGQALLVQEMLEKAVPGVGKTLLVTVEANGITTVSGRVDEFSDRLKMIHTLQGIPGCTAIRYDLRVSAPGANAASVYAAAPAAPAAPAKLELVPPIVVPAVKPTVVVLEVKQAQAVTPVVVMPTFPKLLGPISTAKRQAPSIADMEQRASQLMKSDPVIVQTGRVQEMPVSVKDSAINMAQDGCVLAADHLAQKNKEQLVSTSLSGLFPPGMSGRSMEPVILIGSPVIVRASFETESNKPDVVKSNELIQTSTAVPTSVMATEPTPIQINIMPRLGK